MCPPNIVLTTFNARYTHTSIGLRYLRANMQHLRTQTHILEFTLQESPQDAAEKIAQLQPAIVGIGAYIWNVQLCAELCSIIKHIAPQTSIIIGGPEVSHQPIRIPFEHADYIIQGEADIAFYHTCQAIIAGLPPRERIITAPPVDMNAITLPYDEYTDMDIAQRYMYIEASRGCPFRCEFCLSSMDNSVRNIDTDRFLQAMQRLWQRGARSFKFIDRTFNLNIQAASQILDFFLGQSEPYFVHFEMIPDHFPTALKKRIRQFPPAALQLEIGIQTLNPDVGTRIQRKIKLEKMIENIQFLEQESHAHMHLDLIIGLPGETLESFALGLNQLYALSTSEIQIGVLKKLSGTALHRHDDACAMVYADTPPYDILQNQDINFQDMQEMKRLAKFWDLYHNRGNFHDTLPMLWPQDDVFEQFRHFSQWLYTKTGRAWGIALEQLAAHLFEYLCTQHAHSEADIAALLTHDLMKHGDRKMPKFLKPFSDSSDYVYTAKQTTPQARQHNRRQKRHQATS